MTIIAVLIFRLRLAPELGVRSIKNENKNAPAKQVGAFR